MRMPDVNILVYAHRAEMPQHARYAAWLSDVAAGNSPFALSESVIQGFIRIVTNTRAFETPSPMADAFLFIDGLAARPDCTVVRAGPLHGRIFRQLCDKPGIQGNLVADAAHAALAIESGCEWITADTDFARFAPTLRWQHL
jgi:uncharacterized protein